MDAFLRSRFQSFNLVSGLTALRAGAIRLLRPDIGASIVLQCKGTTNILISKTFYNFFYSFLPFDNLFYLSINFIVFFLPFYQKSDKRTIFSYIPIYIKKSVPYFGTFDRRVYGRESLIRTRFAKNVTVI